MVQVLASVIVAASAAAAIVRVCWQPWQCNREEARIQGRIEKMLAFSDTTAVRIDARRNLDAIEHCIRADPTVVNRYMLKAALLRIVRRPEDAIATYRMALRIDRRPELWYNLGYTELQGNRVAPAMENLARATLISTYFIGEIPEPYYSQVLQNAEQYLGPLRERRASPTLPHELRLRLERDPP